MPGNVTRACKLCGKMGSGLGSGIVSFIFRKDFALVAGSVAGDDLVCTRFRMDAQHKFSSRLAESIKRSGLSRPEFAARAGVGTSALTKWLSGKLTPKSEQLLNLANTANVTMEWLLIGDAEGVIRSKEARLDAYMAHLKKLIPQNFKDAETADMTRDMVLDIIEFNEESMAAGAVGRLHPDIVAVSDLMESASVKFLNSFEAFSKALENATATGDSVTQELILQRWQEVAASVKVLKRRMEFLLSEIRWKHDIPF